MLDGQNVLRSFTPSVDDCPGQDFGCNVTFSEMATAQKLILDSYHGKRERARLHRAPNEKCFGLQIATTRVSEGVFAGKLAAQSGLDFIGGLSLHAPSMLLPAAPHSTSQIPCTCKMQI